MIEGTLGAGAIIVIILAVLPYIAIIGTWTEISRSRKERSEDLEYISELLEQIREESREILNYKREGNNFAGFQPAESETEQNRPNV